MYFAVKTCSKYHKDRIPVVKHTWAKYVLHIGFYSESEGNIYSKISGVSGRMAGSGKHCMNHIKRFSVNIIAHEAYGLVGFNAMQFRERPPFAGTHRFHLQSRISYSSCSPL
jgi:hypothetical protein